MDKSVPLLQLVKPKTRARVKRRQEIQQSVSRKKQCLRDKLFASDFFNEPLTQKEFDLLYPFALSEDKIQTKAQDMYDKLEQASFVSTLLVPPQTAARISDEEQFAGVFEFIIFSHTCVEWLNSHLEQIGWKCNMTKYNPICVSHSVNELRESTIECLKMACKQMLRFQQLTTQTQPCAD